MEVIKTMSPGSPGTKRYIEEWQSQLVAVRYRKDEAQHRVVTTIEIIVDQRPLYKSPHLLQSQYNNRDHQIVHIRIDYEEKDLRAKIKAAGGTWLPHLGAWAIPFREVKTLGLIGRML